MSQSVIVLVSSLNVLWTTYNFDSGQGLTWTNQIISWGVIGLFIFINILRLSDEKFYCSF